MTADMLLSQTPTGWLARFALRISSAVDLTRLSGYHDLTTVQRYERARAEDVAYFGQLSTVDSPVALEFRWLASDPVELAVLGRLERPNRESAAMAAAWVMRALASLPAHVRWESVDPAEIGRLFAPFRVHPKGIAELRRPCLVAEPERPDAGVPYYLAVPSWRSAPAEWPRLLELLAGIGVPAMVSIGLEPQVLGPEYGAMLSSVADRYGVLARPGESRLGGGLYSGPTWLPADRFASYAEERYRDAATRYRRGGFRLRVTVAADRPIDGHLARSVAGLLSATAQESCVVEAPGSPMDLGMLLDSVTNLGVPTWGGHPIWQSQPRALRLLSELADPEEAAATIWLPAAATGTLRGMPITEPTPDQLPASAGVHFHNSTVDITGDVVGGNKHEL
jgi:hypothetical protein